MKCPVCRQRKGKRYCPAKKTSICPQCCGEKRVIEIACPSDCEYLASGQGFRAGKEVGQQLTQEHDLELREKILLIRLRFPLLIQLLERSVVEFAQNLSSLTDQDIAEATRIVLDRYRLEQKGLIFQNKSPKPFVEALAAELSRRIEDQRKQAAKDLESSARPALELFITALEVMEADIRHHAGKATGPTTYLNHTRRGHPEVAPPKRGGGLIIPG